MYNGEEKETEKNFEKAQWLLKLKQDTLYRFAVFSTTRSNRCFLNEKLEKKRWQRVFGTVVWQKVGWTSIVVYCWERHTTKSNRLGRKPCENFGRTPCLLARRMWHWVYVKMSNAWLYYLYVYIWLRILLSMKNRKNDLICYMGMGSMPFNEITHLFRAARNVLQLNS